MKNLPLKTSWLEKLKLVLHIASSDSVQIIIDRVGLGNIRGLNFYTVRSFDSVINFYLGVRNFCEVGEGFIVMNISSRKRVNMSLVFYFLSSLHLDTTSCSKN